MEIKVLGTGCKSCKKLYQNTKEAAINLGVIEDVAYVTDIAEISRLGVYKTPAVIINNVIVSLGNVLSVEQLRKIIIKYQKPIV